MEENTTENQLDQSDLEAIWGGDKKILWPRKGISKKPYWQPLYKQPQIQKEEIEFMKKFYDDVEGIIAASQKLDYNKLPCYKYLREIFIGRHYWNEDRHRMEPRGSAISLQISELGLIEQAFEAAERQLLRTGKRFPGLGPFDFIVTPPCNLDFDITGAGCRLLWGQCLLNGTTDVNESVFGFFMCGREFTVCVHHDSYLPDDPKGEEWNAYLAVTLLRGEPLDNPSWGTLLKKEICGD